MPIPIYALTVTKNTRLFMRKCFASVDVCIGLKLGCIMFIIRKRGSFFS